MPGSVHRLHVDHAERPSALLDAVQRSGAFDVRVLRLVTGDYLIDHEVLIERKTIADFAISLIDGRLFPQVARLARSRYRSVLLIEGPRPAAMPDLHPQHGSMARSSRLQPCGAFLSFTHATLTIRCAFSNSRRNRATSTRFSRTAK